MDLHVNSLFVSTFQVQMQRFVLEEEHAMPQTIAYATRDTVEEIVL
jgi:hypothetical protein